MNWRWHRRLNRLFVVLAVLFGLLVGWVVGVTHEPDEVMIWDERIDAEDIPMRCQLLPASFGCHYDEKSPGEWYKYHYERPWQVSDYSTVLFTWLRATVGPWLGLHAVLWLVLWIAAGLRRE